MHPLAAALLTVVLLGTSSSAAIDCGAVPDGASWISLDCRLARLLADVDASTELGALQANEVVKELLGIGTSLAGSLVLFDSLETTFRKVKVPRDPACALCGPQATIHDLQAMDYRTGEPLCAA